jgi:hypothetical protein
VLKKVYISGPITGLPELNKPAFDAYAHALSVQGIGYFNPHAIPPPTENLEEKALWQYYMRLCVKALPDCSEIHMLNGWEASSGARWEKSIAEMLGLHVVLQVKG